VPVVFLVLPATVRFALLPGLFSIVSLVTMGWGPRAEDAMTDQQPVEPDAILDRGGAAVPYRRAGDTAAPPASHTLIPMLARMATAGPVLTASAFGISALAAAFTDQVHRPAGGRDAARGDPQDRAGGAGRVVAFTSSRDDVCLHSQVLVAARTRRHAIVP
jgi:hypothetical protein